MLVLSRMIGQSILIGNNIRVKVQDVRGGLVQLCIDAPREIAVDREELRERKRREPRK